MLHTTALTAERTAQHEGHTPHRERAFYDRRRGLRACPPHLALRWVLTAEGLRMRWSIGTPHVQHLWW
jgi:hypothetical protein